MLIDVSETRNWKCINNFYNIDLTLWHRNLKAGFNTQIVFIPDYNGTNTSLAVLTINHDTIFHS